MTLLNAGIVTILMLITGAVFLVADSRLPPKPEIIADTNVGFRIDTEAGT
jgi:hypothetical protein